MIRKNRWVSLKATEYKRKEKRKQNTILRNQNANRCNVLQDLEDKKDENENTRTQRPQ